MCLVVMLMSDLSWILMTVVGRNAELFEDWSQLFNHRKNIMDELGLIEHVQ